MSGVLAPPALVVRRRATGETLALDLARELGAGGEARVLAVPGDDSLVAKLYHEPTLAKARKVVLMMAAEPSLEASAAALAWPRDLLTEADGGFAGFLMERAAGPRVFELYNPSTRRHAAPRGDYALLHRVAANLAAAFEALHARGYVIGDVNESNVLVRPGGAVTLVDTDSMQVRDPADGTVHRSRVGKAEFTPPELQGRSFADFDRSPEHDRFGLAVLLFLLLMEGTHPFAGRLEDGGEMPPIEERIRRGLFPHDDHVEIHPPKLAPDFSLLDPGLRALFVRCFEDGHAEPSMRPTAAEWRAALAAAETKLRECGKNQYHRFGAHLEACPWCERAALLGGRDPFPEKAPPLERRPRGTNRKGAVALRAAKKTALAPRSAAARKVALAPASANARRVAPAKSAKKAPLTKAAKRAKKAAKMKAAAGPRKAAVSAPLAAYAPMLSALVGPSGVQHPASWVMPAITLLAMGPTGFAVLCIAALSFPLMRWLVHKPGGRINRHTVIASALMVAVALVLAAGARAIGAAELARAGAAPAASVEAGVEVEIRLRAESPVDAGPVLVNSAEIERLIAERAGAARAAGRYLPLTVGISLSVLPDGSVGGTGTTATHGGDPGMEEAVREISRRMRFAPPTLAGEPVQSAVWMDVVFDGSSRR